MVYDPTREEIVLIGGRGRNVDPAEVWRWNGVEWRSASAAPPLARDSHGLVFDESGERIILFGGQDAEERGQSETWILACASSCPADFNGDGVADIRDVVEFLNAWAAKDPAADFNGDGLIDTRDFLAFLNAWSAGCP